MDSRGMVNMSSLSFSEKAEISFLMFLLTPLIQADEDDQLRSTGIFATVFWCIGSTYLRLGRFKFWNRFPAGAGFFFLTSSDNIRIYIETAGFVVISYVSLLLVNWSHIWLAVFPLIAVGFILVLCYELSRLSTSQQEHGAGQGSTIICRPSVQEAGDGRDPEKDERHEAAVLVPYWVFCIMGHYTTADNFAVSQFLLFFSSMLGALTRMLMRLALTGASPGVARAAVLLRKATLLVLLATVHALAAELLGENVVLFILPELVPVLLWFSLHLDSDNSSSFISTAKDRIESCFNVPAAAVGAPAAALGALFAFVPSDTMADEVVLSWYAKAMVSCAVSGLLVYYLAFMLSQWPELESTTTAPFVKPAKLLKHWAKRLVIAAAVLLLYPVLAGVGLGLLEQMVAQTVKIFQ